jgi:hypothetical protein
MFTFTVSNNHHFGLGFTSVQLFKKTLTNIDTMHEEIKSNSSSGHLEAHDSKIISSRMIKFEDVLLKLTSN